MFNLLSQSRHITDYHFFFLYEFKISIELQEFSFNEILERFIRSFYFTDEFQLNKSPSKREIVTRDAFLINKLLVDDFKINYAKSRHLLNYFQIDDDEVFYLKLDWFVDTEKVIETHYIYVYLLTFIAINKSKSRLLLFDYSFD